MFCHLISRSAALALRCRCAQCALCPQCDGAGNRTVPNRQDLPSAMVSWALLVAKALCGEKNFRRKEKLLRSGGKPNRCRCSLTSILAQDGQGGWSTFAMDEFEALLLLVYFVGLGSGIGLSWLCRCKRLPVVPEVFQPCAVPLEQITLQPRISWPTALYLRTQKWQP